jgi:hypothetical protein
MMEEDAMNVKTSFVPLRMIVGQKEPVNLHVDVKNLSRKPKSYSISAKVPSKLGFDRSGLMLEKRIRLGGVPPGKTESAVFSIYGKFGLKQGFYDVELLIREHEDRFDKQLSQAKVTSTLRVE